MKNRNDSSQQPDVTRVRTSPRVSGPVRVRGSIRVSHGFTMFVSWRIREKKREIYGGWIDANCAIAILDDRGVRTYQAGEFFPPGCFIEPVEDSIHGWVMRVSSFLLPEVQFAIEADGSLAEISSTPYPFSVSVKHRRINSVSTDGTRIPVDCYGELEQCSPTFVHVYGGFGKSNTSFFSSQIASRWLDQGFNIALIHTRGGAEYGTAWHEQARLQGRALVRYDVESAIHTLQDQKVCTPQQTFLHGMSHGALVVASTAMHSPSLASNYLCRVPIANTRNIHIDDLSHKWITEYGDSRVSDWEAFMKKEDPIAVSINGSLKDTAWFISAYVDDEVTPVSHADLLVEKLRANLAAVTYYRYSSPGTHQGAVSSQIRQEHSDQFWDYLTTQAGKTNKLLCEPALAGSHAR